MAWRNYKWAANVRGVNAYESRVLFALAGAADAEGIAKSFRIRRLFNEVEMSRRMLFNVLASLEAKDFITRVYRIWGKTEPVITKKIEKAGRDGRLVKSVPKGAKQVPNGYRLNLNRFFPKSSNQTIWIELLEKIRRRQYYGDGIFRVYLESIKETYYVRITQTLHVKVSSLDHKLWLETEFVELAIREGIDSRPRIVAIRISHPNANSDFKELRRQPVEKHSFPVV